ncbi:nucleotidyltransferase [Thiospirochaeta perfilievii]|uniref:Nucleotidyltransferase n=1 Tax=Thiospirochaeta perfilievii TaxID=252967 RepID=A0A5C1QF43_9SPIO|nr:nucleotidyltransferase substrate binding protein [Thiospirochaeta perfilievii]QEN05659.1 nucleotidyltransferase [Thiospirochaeta perfilievii]
MINDIRWIQRFDNFKRALKQLNSATQLYNTRELSDLEEQGLIQSFEYNHELAWNLLKDFLEYRGNLSIYGSRDATKEAFKYGLITNGEVWMSMIKSRNRTSHSYNKSTAKEIIKLIVGDYIKEYNQLNLKMTQLKDTEDNNE